MSLMIVASFSFHRITFCHLPFQSKWLYIGTERGNVHIVNVESFMLSGYVIMWNKAIELWVALTSFFFLTLWWFLSNKISLKSLPFSLSSSSHTSEHRAAQALFSNFSFIFKSCLIVGGLYKSELSCYNNRLLWLVNRIIVNIFFTIT